MHFCEKSNHVDKMMGVLHAINAGQLSDLIIISFGQSLFEPRRKIARIVDVKSTFRKLLNEIVFIRDIPFRLFTFVTLVFVS